MRAGELGRMDKGASLRAPLLGLGLAGVAYWLLAGQDATVKFLTASLPVWQILFFRSLVVTAALVLSGRGVLLRRVVGTPNKLALVVRGVVALAAWLCYFTAARTLPLAQLVTLYFAAPVFVTLLARPLLGEQVPPSRWVAVALGFAGTVAASSPGHISLTLATVLVLAGALLWACSVILTRKIASREASALQMLYSNCVFLVLTGTLSVMSWHTLSGTQLLLVLLVGLLGGLGQFALFESARRAPASLTAPVEYTALVWAFVLGYAIWGDVPHWSVFVGAGLISLGGLGLLLGERRRLLDFASRESAVARGGDCMDVLPPPAVSR
jgi:drug/metabolite transporter (DMT)-like permease